MASKTSPERGRNQARERREENYVAYLRVSTNRQGIDGLGVEAQRKTIADYISGNGKRIVAEFKEVESGKNCKRPELERALVACRLMPATLIVAKMDRLARDTAFLMNLKNAGVEFVACDFPEANRMIVGILASVAEGESHMISERTRAAMAAAKARGQTFGGNKGKLHLASPLGVAASARARGERKRLRAMELGSIIQPMREEGATLQALADHLNRIGFTTPRGCQWTPAGVRGVLQTLRGLA